jgi:uncharacterized membrane protein
MAMSKSEIRLKTKLLAKTTLRPIFFRVIFVLALVLVTEIILSAVTAELADRLFPNAVFTVWKYEIPYMEAVFGIIGSVFSMPLILGSKEYLLAAARLKKAKVTDIFLWYADSDRIKASLSYFGWMLIYSIFSFLMQSVTSFYIVNQIQEVISDASEQLVSGAEHIAFNLSLLDYRGILVSAGISILFLILSVRFILIPYLMADDLKLNSFKAAGMSWKIMRGHTVEYIVLFISFAGWYLLTTMTMFIAGLYFYPYFEMTVAIFTEYVRADRKMRDGLGESAE